MLPTVGRFDPHAVGEDLARPEVKDANIVVVLSHLGVHYDGEADCRLTSGEILLSGVTRITF